MVSNLPDYLRTAASLTATTGASASTTHQLAANETGITVAPGVSIRTDPLGSINLLSQTALDVEGALLAPGGTINLSLDSGKNFYYDTASGSFNALKIGDQATLSTAGVFLPGAGPNGLTTGQVLSGGTVSITASKNDLDIAPGATIDVSGTRHTVDLPLSYGHSAYLHADVASEGGRIAIQATENAYLDGTFKGNGGDASWRAAASRWTCFITAPCRARWLTAMCCWTRSSRTTPTQRLHSHSGMRACISSSTRSSSASPPRPCRRMARRPIPA